MRALHAWAQKDSLHDLYILLVDTVIIQGSLKSKTLFWYFHNDIHYKSAYIICIFFCTTIYYHPVGQALPQSCRASGCQTLLDRFLWYFTHKEEHRCHGGGWTIFRSVTYQDIVCKQYRQTMCTYLGPPAADSMDVAPKMTYKVWHISHIINVAALYRVVGHPEIIVNSNYAPIYI